MIAKGAAFLTVGSLVMLVAAGRASADGDCSDNRLVQVGRLPDVIFPAGKATCVVIPPELLKVKAIADTSEGNCGLCVHVRTGSPHIGVNRGGAIKQNCVAARFATDSDGNAVATGGELTSTVGVIETIRHYNAGFTIFSDGTPGSGTIEISSRDGNSFHNHCDPNRVYPPFPDGGHGAYVIGTFNYYVTAAAVTDTAFTHVVSTANSPVPSHTVISHPFLDGQPSAQPIAMSVWNYGDNAAVDNNHAIGMQYGVDVANQWSIVNLDGGALQLGAQFNVEVAPSSDTGAFVAPPIPAYRRSMRVPSIMDHDAQALLFPTGGGSLPNGASSVGSYFNAAAGWSIWNMTGTQMPDGANFLVRFISSPSQYLFAQRVQATSSNTSYESLYLDNSTGMNQSSRLFVSPIYAPGPASPYGPDGPSVYAPLGLWWTGTNWALWRQDWQNIPLGAAFNAYWHQPAIVAGPTPGDGNADRFADLLLIGGGPGDDACHRLGGRWSHLQRADHRLRRKFL
jgi:hypothetical protein